MPAPPRDTRGAVPSVIVFPKLYVNPRVETQHAASLREDSSGTQIFREILIRGFMNTRRPSKENTRSLRPTRALMTARARFTGVGMTILND